MFKSISDSPTYNYFRYEEKMNFGADIKTSVGENAPDNEIVV